MSLNFLITLNTNYLCKVYNAVQCNISILILLNIFVDSTVIDRYSN